MNVREIINNLLEKEPDEEMLVASYDESCFEHLLFSEELWNQAVKTLELKIDYSYMYDELEAKLLELGAVSVEKFEARVVNQEADEIDPLDLEAAADKYDRLVNQGEEQ